MTRRQEGGEVGAGGNESSRNSRDGAWSGFEGRRTIFPKIEATDQMINK